MPTYILCTYIVVVALSTGVYNVETRVASTYLERIYALKYSSRIGVCRTWKIRIVNYAKSTWVVLSYILFD